MLVSVPALLKNTAPVCLPPELVVLKVTFPFASVNLVNTSPTRIFALSAVILNVQPEEASPVQLPPDVAEEDIFKLL